MGNILTLGYKTTLLSFLIPIRYEDTIDNIYDLDKSGLPLLLPKGTFLIDYIEKDPREVIARIYSRKIFITIDGDIPTWPFEM